MDALTAVMLFAALGAAVCVKARATGPAVLFALVALGLFALSPMGAQVPEAWESLRAAWDAARAGGAS